jgi:uncharacterized protein (TIGR03089 family)
VTSPAATVGPPQLLDRALRADPARPLITFYDDETGERTELSVATFANWVAKTANLLRDDLGVEPGATLSLDLPPHWQAAVWLQSAWALGLHVVPAGAAAEIAVIGYDGTPPPGAADVVALGLGPLGLPRRDTTAPAGSTLDYDREVPGHGDRFVPDRVVDLAGPALTAGGRTMSGADLGAAAQAAPALPAGSRLLVAEPLSRVAAVLGAVLVPLATEVTAVICRHLDLARLPSRVTQEGLAAAVAPDMPELSRWEPREGVGPPG